MAEWYVVFLITLDTRFRTRNAPMSYVECAKNGKKFFGFQGVFSSPILSMTVQWAYANSLSQYEWSCVHRHY